MSFDTLPFWVFLLAVWSGYLVIPVNGIRKGLLIAASYFFYAAFFPPATRPAYILLLAGFTLASYAIGRITFDGRRRPLMIAGVAACVAALFATKIRLAPLPVGISFYALQAIAYIVDRYRGNLAQPAGFFDYTLYMSFFPRLAAGPIVRAEEFLPQLAKRPRIDTNALWDALVLIVFGLFKKLVIADNLANAVDPVFANLHASPSHLLLAPYAFGIQVYCDFAGYSDMAIGTARLFGYLLPENFNWPYLSRNPPDFWRRWHITLSRWLREYVYFSLPGLRASSRVFQYVNITITMLVCGLWHGLGWTYALWGLYHGLLIAGYYAIRARRPRGESKAPGLGSVLLMQQLAMIGWILFRVNRIGDLPVYFAGLLHGPFFTGYSPAEWMAVALLGLVAVAHVIETVMPITRTFLLNRWNPWLMTVLLALALATAIWSVPKEQVFLYFRF